MLRLWPICSITVDARANITVLQLNTILGFQYRASTQLRLQTFKIRTENESRVGTLLRRNLAPYYIFKQTKTFFFEIKAFFW